MWKLFRRCLPVSSEVIREFVWQSNHKTRVIPVLAPGEWYNLETGRVLIHAPIPKWWGTRTVRVVGNEASVKSFCAQNSIPLTDIYYPGDDVPTLCAQYEAEVDRRKTAPDPSRVFEWAGIRAPGKVLNVVDGDTVDVRLMVPIKNLDVKAYHVRRKATLDVTLRLRLLGIDAVEHDTPLGPVALSVTRDALLGKQVWATLYGADKYGKRTLGILYFDKARTRLANDLLIHEGAKREQILAVAYQGDRKTLGSAT